MEEIYIMVFDKQSDSKYIGHAMNMEKEKILLMLLYYFIQISIRQTIV